MSDGDARIRRATRVMVTHSFVALRTEHNGTQWNAMERKAEAELQRSATHFGAFQYPPEETQSCQTR
jgi:hypothetical protein